MRKQSRFIKFSLTVLAFSMSLFIIASIGLISYESTLNKRSQDLQDEIISIKSDIEGLNVQKQELSSFARISSVARSNGYNYRAAESTANAVVSSTNE